MLTDFMCSASVIALMFTSFERLSLYARDKDDAMNAINAATLTGALFKSTTGLRQSIAWAIRKIPLFFTPHRMSRYNCVLRCDLD